MARHTGRMKAAAAGTFAHIRPHRSALIALALLLTAVGVALAGPAGSIESQDPTGPTGLAKAGPVSAIGFPDWYKDKRGTVLEPCLDPKDPMCVMGTVPNPDAPLSLSADAPLNFPDEMFYFMGDSAIDSVGTADPVRGPGKASLTLSLEGAFAGGAAKLGDQTVFSRFRVRVTGGLDLDTPYKVHYPFGTATLKTDPDDPSIFVTDDVGTIPGAFSDALNGRIGPFLQWTPDPSLPDGYVGDPAVPHTVTGSPADIDQNFFAIVGPNAGASVTAENECSVTNIGAGKMAALGNPSSNDCVYTDLFTVMGKKSVRGGVDVRSATYSRSADGATTKVDVVAESKADQNIQVEDPDPVRRLTPGRIFPTTRADADNGDYLAHITIPGADGPPDTVAVVNYSDTPRTVKKPHPIDRVTGTAVFNADDNTLRVVAASSDKSSGPGGPSAKLSLPYYHKQLTPLDPPDADAAQAADVAMGAPPATVTVESTREGTVELPVTVTGADSARAGLWADAGKDRTVTPNASIKLDGSNSSGNIDGYQWTGPYDVAADGTFTARAATGVVGHNAIETVNAPGTDGAKDGYRLTLTGTPAGGAADRTADEMIVTARTPPPVVEALAFTGARYRGDQQRWVVDGTSSETAGNEITVYNGPTARGEVIGTALVDRLGVWALDVRDSALIPKPCADPAAGDCVSIRSTNGTVVEGFVVDVTKPPPAPLVAAAAAAAAAAAVPLAGAPVVRAAVKAPAALTAVPSIAAGTPITVRTLAASGLPITVTVPAGVTVVRVRVLTTSGRVLLKSFHRVKGGHKVKIRVSGRQLRKLRGGRRYVLETTAGTARTHLGRATRVTFRVR